MADKRLIDASKLLTIFCTDCGMREGSCSNSCEKDCAIYDTITSASTVEAQPVKHGRWMNRNGHPVSTALSCYSAKCSECELYSGMQYINKPYNYCPYCGTRMDLKEI